jgi:hypothetical protein
MCQGKPEESSVKPGSKCFRSIGLPSPNTIRSPLPPTKNRLDATESFVLVMQVHPPTSPRRYVFLGRRRSFSTIKHGFTGCGKLSFLKGLPRKVAVGRRELLSAQPGLVCNHKPYPSENLVFPQPIRPSVLSRDQFGFNWGRNNFIEPALFRSRHRTLLATTP